MTISLIDQLRTVPEIACRLYLGAEKVQANGAYIVRLDGEEHKIPLEIFNECDKIAQTLKVRERRVEYASDVLNLRHDAEDLFLENILGEKALKILFVPAGHGAGRFYRSRLPAEFLGQGNFDVLPHHTDCLDLSKALRYDVLLIQLAAVPLLYEIAKAAQENGVRVVYDIDDRWDAIPDGIPGKDMFETETVTNIEKMIALADLVTVSTEPLREFVLTKGAKRVEVIKNNVPTPILPSRATGDGEVFRILWAGSPSHRQDLEVMAPALCRVLAQGKGKVRFTCFGEKPPESLEGVFKYVDTIRFVDFADYAQTLAEVGADVAIAPLVDNDFNACKSGVKFLEYATAGYPGLYSPVGEYAYLRDIGAPIRTVENGEWENVLNDLIYNVTRKWLKDEGEKAQKWVKSNRCLAASKAKEWFQVAQEAIK